MTALWDAYNAEDSFLPFWIPFLGLWLPALAYCWREKRQFHRFYLLHNIHNIGGILLALVSIYCNDDAIFNERVHILWSASYFSVDLVDCGTRGDWGYSLHAVLSLTLSACNYTIPLGRQLRMNSKGFLTEISTPFMHLCKKTRRTSHFALFALVYTLCRVVWIPYLGWQLHQHGLAWTVMAVIGAFYVLNLYWYVKIWKIVMEGVKGQTAKKEL